MGKIFGISDLPVSTIMTPFEQIMDFRNPYGESAKNKPVNFENKPDVFVSKAKPYKSNPFIRMRNGFGKLMRHFSGKLPK